MVGEWIVLVISFKKILCLSGLNGHIMEIRLGVTLVHVWTDGRMECEDRARILDAEFAIKCTLL